MLTITENIDSYLTASEERKYFSLFSKELKTSKDEEQSINELTKRGYKAVSDKISEVKHDSAPPAFKKSTKHLEKAMSTKKRFSEYNSHHRHKKHIVLSGRVHPGETNSSYCIQGTIEFLISNTPEAKFLRNYFIFKIVPMLNPDGVAIGNYR
jgi:hypothetical protein